MAPARLRQMAMPRRSERAWVATARLWRKAKSGQRVTTMAEVEGGAEAKGTGPATAVWGGAKSCEGLSNDAKAGEEGVRASEKMAPRARLRGCEGGMGAERCGAAQAPPAAQVFRRTVAPRPRARGAPLSPSRRRVVGRGLSKGPRLRPA